MLHELDIIRIFIHNRFACFSYLFLLFCCVILKYGLNHAIFLLLYDKERTCQAENQDIEDHGSRIIRFPYRDHLNCQFMISVIYKIYNPKDSEQKDKTSANECYDCFIRISSSNLMSKYANTDE